MTPHVAVLCVLGSGLLEVLEVMHVLEVLRVLQVLDMLDMLEVLEVLEVVEVLGGAGGAGGVPSTTSRGRGLEQTCLIESSEPGTFCNKPTTVPGRELSNTYPQ